jgi:hypothetical protein
MKHVKCGLLAMSALLSLACGNEPTSRSGNARPTPATEPASPVTESSAFFELARRVRYSYPGFRHERDMRNTAHAVVVGTAVDITDGRTYIAPAGDLAALHTYVIKVEVERWIKGSGEKFVYVEMDRGQDTSIAELAQNTPNERMVLYLTDTASYEERAPVYDKGVRRRSPGSPLYRLTSPQGMVIEMETGLRQPLADEDRQIFAGQAIRSTDL